MQTAQVTTDTKNTETKKNICIPKHIVLFPDGNRRWARNRGLDLMEGHLEGERRFGDFLTWCKDIGVEVITVFGFSTENWNRTPYEVKYLMGLLERFLKEGIGRFGEEGVQVRVIGQKERLPKSLQQVIAVVEKATKNNSELHLNLAVSYGGKWDILQAVKKMMEEGIDSKTIDETIFSNHLSTAGLPDPDLVIRAGGEKRLSNFVLWQAAYAELYFCPTLWPDFSKQDFDAAIQEFDRRARRFGH